MLDSQNINRLAHLLEENSKWKATNQRSAKLLIRDGKYFRRLTYHAQFGFNHKNELVAQASSLLFVPVSCVVELALGSRGKNYSS